MWKIIRAVEYYTQAWILSEKAKYYVRHSERRNITGKRILQDQVNYYWEEANFITATAFYREKAESCRVWRSILPGRIIVRFCHYSAFYTY